MSCRWLYYRHPLYIIYILLCYIYIRYFQLCKQPIDDFHILWTIFKEVVWTYCENIKTETQFLSWYVLSWVSYNLMNKAANCHLKILLSFLFHYLMLFEICENMGYWVSYIWQWFFSSKAIMLFLGKYDLWMEAEFPWYHFASCYWE